MASHTWDIIVRLLLAVLCGGLVGLERELRSHPAGLRTHILVAVGASIITSISLFGFPDADPARVAASIAVGVGFIGAGAILRSEGGVISGLTTAASIWSSAALGMLCGVGFFTAAIVSTVVILVILSLTDWKPDLMLIRFKVRNLSARVAGEFDEGTLPRIKAILIEHRCRPEVFSIDTLEDGRRVDVLLVGQAPASIDLRELEGKLQAVDGVHEVRLISPLT